MTVVARRRTGSSGGVKALYDDPGSLRFDLTSQQFDWRRGTFTTDDEVPLWLKLLLHLVICAALIVVPVTLYSKGLVATPYQLFASEPPKVYSQGLELIRATLFLAMGYLAFVLTNILAITMTYSVYHYYRLRGRSSTPAKARRIIDHMLFLRVYAAWFVTSIVLLAGAFILYPISPEEAALQLKEIALGAAAEEKGGKGKGGNDLQEAAEVITGLAAARSLREYGAGHSLQFFVNRLAAALFVFCGLILLEKIVIQKIMGIFYYRSFGTRIEENTFGVKTTRRLRELILQRHPELTGADLSTIIFSGLCPTHRSAITVADMVAYVPSTDADRLFQMLDPDSVGELNLIQVRRSVTRLLDEQENLHLALLDQAQVIRKLDRLFMVFAIILAMIPWMALFQVSLQTILVALAGISSFVLAASNSTVKTAFESIVFVIFTHPFDVGDKVMIRDDEYVVKELGLWTTTFIGSTNQLTYIANSKLRTEMIVNTRRSPFQSELVRVSVLPSTSREQIKALEAKLLAFLEANPRDYVPRLTINGFTIINKDTMRIEIPLTHRGNFQDSALKASRSSAFILYLKEALLECGISISPPAWITTSA